MRRAGKRERAAAEAATVVGQGRTLALDLTTLLTLSFSATSTAVIFAATELLS